MDVTAIIIAASIPSAITGFCFWLIERNIKKQDKKREAEEEARREDMERRENLRQQQEFYLVQGVNAAIALGEATAKAVQRIPDAHCNGDMHAASGDTPKKSNTEIAKEVIAGKWGNGADRKKRLEAAGYNYAAVQKIVNSML